MFYGRCNLARKALTVGKCRAMETLDVGSTFNSPKWGEFRACWLNWVPNIAANGSSGLGRGKNRLPMVGKTMLSNTGYHEVASNSIIRHLGKIIHSKFILKGHLDYAREKIAKACSSLARMMPNIGRLKFNHRDLPEKESSINPSIVLKICSIYRTVSDETAVSSRE